MLVLNDSWIYDEVLLTSYIYIDILYLKSNIPNVYHSNAFSFENWPYMEAQLGHRNPLEDKVFSNGAKELLLHIQITMSPQVAKVFMHHEPSHCLVDFGLAYLA